MRRTLIALLGALALLGAGCGSGDDPTVPTSPTAAAPTIGGTDVPTTPTDPAGGCDDQSEADQAHVSMEDSFFDPTCLIANGQGSLFLQNNGAGAHTFTIPDSPIDVELGPGEQQELSAPSPLEPGEYVFYCTFHGTAAGGGMAGRMTVV